MAMAWPFRTAFMGSDVAANPFVPHVATCGAKSEVASKDICHTRDYMEHQ